MISAAFRAPMGDRQPRICVSSLGLLKSRRAVWARAFTPAPVFAPPRAVK